MKLVMLTTNLARGGAEKQVAELATRLSLLGWDIHVVSLVQPTAFVEDLKSAGVTVHAPGLLRLPALMRALQPDIVHAHMFHGNLAARLLRLVLPFPVLIDTIHSLAESSRKSGRIWHRDLLYRMTASLTDMTVAVSAAVAERHVQAHCIRSGALRVIPNGVDTTVYRPDERGQQEFTWIAAGRLLWKKDYPTLLRAFAEVGSGRLLIAGTGPDEAELRRAAPAGVEFLGERSDMPELMRQADGFVLSSIVEGLPVVLLEAAASGLPAVATDVGGVRDTTPAFLVPPGNAHALAEAMRTFMDMSAQERAALGRQARKRAIAEWDWPVITDRWLNLYRELVPWM